jgi:hypothetical protein
MTISSPSTEALWGDRVRAWRSSGKTASTFAEEKGLTLSALRYWAARLSRKPAAPAMVRLVATSAVPAVPAAMTPVAEAKAELVVEVGDAQVRVARGFDPELLRAVVHALGGAR